MTGREDMVRGKEPAAVCLPPTLSPPCQRGKPIVGLVGGIGSGKTQVAAALARAGARVISADELAHEALRQPDVRERIISRWGPHLLDEHGEVQRRRLAAIVFADSTERRALEALDDGRQSA